MLAPGTPFSALTGCPPNSRSAASTPITGSLKVTVICVNVPTVASRAGTTLVMVGGSGGDRRLAAIWRSR